MKIILRIVIALLSKAKFSHLDIGKRMNLGEFEGDDLKFCPQRRRSPPGFSRAVAWKRKASNEFGAFF